MSIGKEYLRQIHEALEALEAAIVDREHPGMLGHKVARQQEVDKARQRLVDVVVQILTQDRLGRGSA